MHFTTSWTRLIAVSLSVALPRVLADFHISTVLGYYPSGTETTTIDLVACPSNYWNCNCYDNGAGIRIHLRNEITSIMMFLPLGDRSGFISYSDYGVPDTFNIQGSGHGEFCGEKQINFYKNGDT